MSMAKITLTKTMLDKHIIDANASVRSMATDMGIDYTAMQVGEKHRLLCTIMIENRGRVDVVVTLYKTKRGDRRVSIQNVKQFANVGDVLTLFATSIAPK